MPSLLLNPVANFSAAHSAHNCLLTCRKACKKMLGGRTKLVLSGGAPLSSSSEEFLRVGVCCPIVQGYGLTETCGGVFASMPHRFEMFGTVGVPLRSTVFRLESVPELGYDALAEPPCGELLIKSPQLFSGRYYFCFGLANLQQLRIGCCCYNNFCCWYSRLHNGWFIPHERRFAKFIEPQRLVHQQPITTISL